MFYPRPPPSNHSWTTVRSCSLQLRSFRHRASRLRLPFGIPLFRPLRSRYKGSRCPSGATILSSPTICCPFRRPSRLVHSLKARSFYSLVAHQPGALPSFPTKTNPAIASPHSLSTRPCCDTSLSRSVHCVVRPRQEPHLDSGYRRAWSTKDTEESIKDGRSPAVTSGRSKAHAEQARCGTDRHGGNLRTWAHNPKVAGSNPAPATK